MEKAKLSVIQLFAMMFMFEMGTSLVVSYGIGAKKDAWLAILLGMSNGIVIFFIYYRLFLQYPTLSLTRYTQKIVGKYIGWFVGFLYIIYFLYITSRQVRDFSELLVSSTMTETPLLAIHISFVLVICYVLYLGIEVLGRTAEVFIIILLLFGIAANFFILVSGSINITHLRPFLEEGWKPIIETAIHDTTPFPFGELIVFTMILPYLNKPESVRKVWLTALIAGGLVLSWTASINIAVLGVDVMERTTFPTLTTIGKVNLLEFIQRLDAIVVFTLFITVFFKASIFLYVTVISVVDLFKLDNHQQILFPIGGIIVFSSMMIASNFSEYMEEARNVLRYYHPLFFFIIPLILLIIATVRNRFKNKLN
ncbi:endospore germination permease [Metabacillus sp. FJAT-53654]|uniref:Endospore germination permease n=1 Tax=Metabacillus rhizosphaerae TaxID=3117747 RepID=A0ABZ2MRB3_9BACI